MTETITHSEEETLRWAEDFSRQLNRGDVVALRGNLGAGKTVVSRGIARGLGFTGGVHSPSYALVHEYPNDPPIFHLDLYRLAPHADLHEIGVEHYSFSEGITLIEWPERLHGLDVGVHYEVQLERIDDETRKIRVIDLRKKETP
jgi:tRNA threonylcarbamoyladenosine biosynthesis protein TsaE